MGITSTLSIAAQSLRTQQLAIQTTGHNLANAATPGFSRQRVDLVSSYPSFEGGTFIGQGANAAGINRVVDGFAEAELLTLNGNVGYLDAQSGALASIQEAFPVTGGIDTALSAFFGALSDLANNPAGLTERVAVIGKAGALGASLAQTRQLFTSIRQNLDENLRSAAQRVNVLAEKVATLNGQISSTEIRGVSANDFRDQRQVLLQELTRLTGATTREETTGEVTVIASGLLLVSGSRSATLHTDTVNPVGLHAVTYETPDGLTLDATSLLTQGEIGSVLDMRDREVQDIVDRLDQLAKTLVDEVNAQHALGFDMQGAAGGDFFTPIAATAGAASTVRIDPAITADPRLIATAATATTAPGDNRNALALANLQSAGFAALGGLTLQDHFLGLVGEVGSRAEIAQSRLQFEEALLAQTQARRESVSGVNVDEEMIKLIQFQRAFEASSLLVRTADGLYDALLLMVR